MTMISAYQFGNGRLNVHAFNFTRSEQLSAALLFSLVFHLLVAVAVGSFVGIPGAGQSHTVTQKTTMRIALRQPIVDNSIVESGKSFSTPSADKLRQLVEKPAQTNTGLDLPPIDGEKSVLVFGPWYFTSKHLHRRPKPLRPVNLEYPPEAGNTSGKVLLRLYISEKGAVDKYEVVEESPPELFRRSAIDAFATETYSPGLITGYVVRSQMLIEVTYSPGNAPQATHISAPEEGGGSLHFSN